MLVSFGQLEPNRTLSFEQGLKMYRIGPIMFWGSQEIFQVHILEIVQIKLIMIENEFTHARVP